MKRVAIVGLGEIGTAVFRAINAQNEHIKTHEIVVYDKNQDRTLEFNTKEKSKCGFSFAWTMPLADIYIVCVYTTEQVLDVLKEIKKLKQKKPLVSIESTINPKELNKIKAFSKSMDIVLFPHRFNPNDAEHAVFNLHRVIGGFDKKAEQRAIAFFKLYMKADFIRKFPVEIVALCKPLENAYRFMEIAIAEELKMLCDEKKIDFAKLREATNTKWNIFILEARDGINGHCLPKDAKITRDYFDGFGLLDEAIAVDCAYKEIKAYKAYKVKKSAKGAGAKCSPK